MARIPLSQRPLDKLWFCFFLIHLPTTLFLDCQAVLPTYLIIPAFDRLNRWYAAYSGDPFLAGMFEGKREMVWFRALIALETFFQLPIFILGAYCLYHNNKKIYPLLLMYASSTVTTMIPVLTHLLIPLSASPSSPFPFTTPEISSSPPKSDVVLPPINDLTSTELLTLLSAYLPFLVFSFGMMVDMGRRVYAWVPGEYSAIFKKVRSNNMSTSRSFVFVTGNANKLKEVKAILSAGTSGIEVTNEGLEVPEVQGSTQEVAIAKCKDAARQLGTACVTEDTALCFEALGDLPGPYIKDFLTKLGHEGLNTLLTGFSTHRAHALCTFAYSPAPTPVDPSPEPILFEGRTYGKIVSPRGKREFGWDCVFEPEEGAGKEGLTYAEMTSEQKNAISHRYKALEKLKDYLLQQ